MAITLYLQKIKVAILINIMRLQLNLMLAATLAEGTTVIYAAKIGSNHYLDINKQMGGKIYGAEH